MGVPCCVFLVRRQSTGLLVVAYRSAHVRLQGQNQRTASMR